MTRALTLIELVITISLAAILGTATGILIGEHLTGSLRARDATVAMNLARLELERIDSLNNFFVTPDLSSPTTVTIPNYQGYPYTLVRTVDCPFGDCVSTSVSVQGVKRIRITVYKPSASNPLETLVASCVTYRTKHVFFGT
ncbi:MAG: type II secretion system protein [Candidatus Omnitrophica bacterium]|nr:type II secretion system protein [Candidatus Omnitrophota bacterium]